MPVLQVHKSEPETLRRHREMYRRRLLEIKRMEGRSISELLDLANSPATFHQTCLDEDKTKAPRK